MPRPKEWECPECGEGLSSVNEKQVVFQECYLDDEAIETGDVTNNDGRESVDERCGYFCPACSKEIDIEGLKEKELS